MWQSEYKMKIGNSPDHLSFSVFCPLQLPEFSTAGTVSVTAGTGDRLCLATGFTVDQGISITTGPAVHQCICYFLFFYRYRVLVQILGVESPEDVPDLIRVVGTGDHQMGFQCAFSPVVWHPDVHRPMCL